MTDARNTAPEEEPNLGVHEDELEAAGIDLTVAEAAAPDREIAVEVGENIVEVQQPDRQVRRPDGARRRDLRHQARRDPRADRSERRRQDDLLQRDDRASTSRPAATCCWRASRSRAASSTRSRGMGLARTFQNIRLFGEMTALENVVVGLDARHRTSVPGALLRLPRHTREEKSSIERGMALLEFVGIADHAGSLSRSLPYGYQRRLEIARALATDPKVLCLDEPAAGFNPAEKEELMDLIRTIRADGYTVLLIEHDMKLVMGVTDRIVVLEFGRKLADDTPEAIRNDPRVIAAYLGEPEDDVA